jgi:hypothetical protein
LDYNKHWYAYHDLLFGYPKSNRRHEESAVFQLFPSDVQKVNIADIQESRLQWQTAILPLVQWTRAESKKRLCNKLFWYITFGDETAKSKRRMAEI